MKRIELLAPAGSALSFRAALENGADAIYLGTEEYSARYYAENFKVEELKDLVSEAHKRGVKIYLTVNTLLNDQEINNYFKYLYKVADAGIDALIVQDLGVVNITRKMIPELPLHGSTQMTINNSSGAAYLKNLGFKRVVLARETSLKEVEMIRKKVDIELEIFGHGALCISYSGICYFSSMLGGRSGNRGKCAQPCRLEYKLFGSDSQIEKNKKGENYLLSTKDLRMIEYLPEIIGSGVSSLKIEGRMKRPEYVAVVVDHYRRAIDSYYNNPDDFSIDQNVLQELDQTFSRGTSTGHYFQKLNQEGMSFKKPNNAGSLAGKIISYARGNAEIKLFDNLAKGDGYIINGLEGELAGEIKEIKQEGLIIDQAKAGSSVSIELKGRVKIGELLYKTRDQALHKRARDSFSSSKIQNKRDIDIKLLLREGSPIIYEVQEENGTFIKGIGEIPLEKALNRPLTKEVIMEQFSRLGNTPFRIRSLDVELSKDLMVPLRELNNIRKSFVEKLEEESLKKFPKVELPEYEKFLEKRPKISNEKIKDRKKKLAVSVSSLKCLKSGIEGGADIIYLYLETLRTFPKLDLLEIQEAISFCKNKAELVFVIPGIIKENKLNAQKEYLEKISDIGAFSFSVANLSGILMAEEKKLFAEHTLNIFNSYALEFLAKEGFVRVVLSPELSLNQINAMKDSKIEKEAIIQGNFPLITTNYCVLSSQGLCIKNNQESKINCKSEVYFKDRKNYHLPLAFDYDCKMHLYNAKEISLYRDLDKILAANIDVYRIESRNDSPENILIKTKMYKEQIDLYNNKGKTSLTKENIEKISGLSPNGLTAGHFFRGVE